MEAFDLAPYDCWALVFDKLDIVSQLNFRNACRSFKCFDIIDLFNVPRKVRWRLDDSIVLQFPKLKHLDAFDNSKITDLSVSKLVNLSTLDASHNPKITDLSVSKLANLSTLYASGNKEITFGIRNSVKIPKS